MIGSVRGRILAKTPPQLLVEAGGLGYELEAPMSTFFHLPAVGEEVRLLTHLVVREDAHVLYAFGTEDERRLFRSLIKVRASVPRSRWRSSRVSASRRSRMCVQTEDVAALIKVPGHRPQDRGAPGRGDARPSGGGRCRQRAPSRAAASPEAEAFGALVALGYKPAEATRLLKAAGPGTHSTEELIRRALKGAAPE